jgi:DNA-binding transcriptional regulator YiaG
VSLPGFLRNVFWLFGLVVFILLLVKIYFVSKFGYLYLFDPINELKGEKILLQFFPLICSLVFASRLSGDKSRLYVLFILIIILSLFTGQRGFFVKNAIGLFIIYTLSKEVRISLSKIAFTVILIFALFHIAFIRVDSSVKQSSFAIILNVVSTSYGILTVVERDKEHLDLPSKSMFAEIRSIVESVVYFVTGGTNPYVQSDKDSLKRYMHSGQFLSNHYNPSAVNLGKGLGTGNLIEAKLIFGNYGLLVVMFLIILFASVGRVSLNPLNIPFIYSFAGSVFFWPRDSLFAPLSDNLVLIILLFLLFVCRSILRL